jgi:hypothetical protein
MSQNATSSLTDGIAGLPDDKEGWG